MKVRRHSNGRLRIYFDSPIEIHTYLESPATMIIIPENDAAELAIKLSNPLPSTTAEAPDDTEPRT